MVTKNVSKHSMFVVSVKSEGRKQHRDQRNKMRYLHTMTLLRYVFGLVLSSFSFRPFSSKPVLVGYRGDHTMPELKEIVSPCFLLQDMIHYGRKNHGTVYVGKNHYINMAKSTTKPHPQVPLLHLS